MPTWRGLTTMLLPHPTGFGPWGWLGSEHVPSLCLVEFSGGASLNLVNPSFSISWTLWCPPGAHEAEAASFWFRFVSAASSVVGRLEGPSLGGAAAALLLLWTMNCAYDRCSEEGFMEDVSDVCPFLNKDSNCGWKTVTLKSHLTPQCALDNRGFTWINAAKLIASLLIANLRPGANVS